MTRMFKVVAALIVLCIALPVSAFADDWLVTKLRGNALQLVGADWAPLERGDVVPDDRVIRTLGGGRAMLQRGRETIEIAANTQIRILDKVGGKPFTTVQQFFGSMSIEAEVRNVQHFAVQTPYLAAVVKGTRFEVKTNSRQSEVKVQRGHVAVEDLHTGAHTLLAAGQVATVGRNGSFKVGGTGAEPVILNAAGKIVSAAAAAKGNLGVTVGKGGTTAGVVAGVVDGRVTVGGDGVHVGIDMDGGTAGVGVEVDDGGVDVEGNVGGTGGGVSVGGDGVSVSVGGTGVGIGLGGLL